MAKETKTPAGMLGGRILIVDDDPEARKFLTEFLRYVGFFHIATAKDGKDALRKVKGLSPRLVLLDYKLPDMVGLEVLRQIKQVHPEVPVIMMTAYPNMDGVEGLIQKGAFDLVLKPLNLQQLEQSVVMGIAS